ncbi:MAG: hydrolase TatD [Sphingomonadales bacterium BRH_c3]|nr:MAG: hydrolase TatD [Sphingomonadales bacterium BRH_c3]
MIPEYVDFHAHLDLYPDLQEAIRSCDKQKTATLAVTTTPLAFKRNHELASSSKFVRVGVGLHPQLVEERYGEIELFEKLLPQTRYVGEVGLDAGPRFYRSLDLQKQVFERVLRLCASSKDKVLSVHSVRATKAVLDMVEKHLPQDKGTVVLHWFTGSVAEVRRAVALGCYFSVNEQMLSSPNGLKIVTAIPTDRILTETDGPFVLRKEAPIPAGDVRRAISLMANTLAIGELQARHVVRRNLKTLLQD